MSLHTFDFFLQNTKRANLLGRKFFGAQRIFFLFCQCNMNYFDDFITTFLGLEGVSCIAVYPG